MTQSLFTIKKIRTLVIEIAPEIIYKICVFKRSLSIIYNNKLTVGSIQYKVCTTLVKVFQI